MSALVVLGVIVTCAVVPPWVFALVLYRTLRMLREAIRLEEFQTQSLRGEVFDKDMEIRRLGSELAKRIKSSRKK